MMMEMKDSKKINNPNSEDQKLSFYHQRILHYNSKIDEENLNFTKKSLNVSKKAKCMTITSNFSKQFSKNDPQNLTKILYSEFYDKIQNNFYNIIEKLDENCNEFIFSEMLSSLTKYNDFAFCRQQLCGNLQSLRLTYMYHIIRHIISAKEEAKNIEKSMSNNHIENSLSSSESPGLKHSGFSRVRALICLPFRNSCLTIVALLIKLLTIDLDKKLRVDNKARFIEEYSPKSSYSSSLSEENFEEIFSKKSPSDYCALFEGNIDDCFQIGIRINRHSLKLYANFEEADLIICSPVALRTIQDKDVRTLALSSIEVLAIDQADVFFMQNWDHILNLLENINCMPSHPGNTDFSKIYDFYLNNSSKNYRQTIILSQFMFPQLASLINCLKNYQGLKIFTQNEGEFNLLSNFKIKIYKFIAKDDDVPNKRQIFSTDIDDQTILNFDQDIEFFNSNILSKYTSISHTLIFIPEFSDFLQLKHLLSQEKIPFSFLDEYQDEAEIRRQIGRFTSNSTNLLLMTGRFFFFSRRRIPAVKHILFFGLPEYPRHFYEICNKLSECEIQVKIVEDNLKLRRYFGRKFLRSLEKCEKTLNVLNL
ncbi:MAG: hypothetical protein MHMPM18_001057 [Marteilia pararefringens]